jgi:hypothetical protein
MYHLLRGPYTGLAIPYPAIDEVRSTYDLPEASVSLVSLLIEALVLRHPVFGVDQAAMSLASSH